LYEWFKGSLLLERARESDIFGGIQWFPFPALNLRAKCHVNVTRYHVVFHEYVFFLLLFELHFPVLTKFKRKTKKKKKKKKSAGNILFTCMIAGGNGPMATSFL
jgi:hypothetical protein